MHFHGFTFRGSADDLKPFDDANRVGGVGFEMAVTPPYQTYGWLARPQRHVRGSWDSPEDAAAWLADRYREIAGSLLRPELQTEAPSIESREAQAVEQLVMGNDVAWSEYLRGNLYTSFHVVCCPNRDGDAPCPTGRSDTRPKVATNG